MKNIICWVKGHKRGDTKVFINAVGGKVWKITCKRCGKEIRYRSLYARLISEEMRYGFDGL